MGDIYEEAPGRMQQVNAASVLIFRQRVMEILKQAGVPKAEMAWTEEGESLCTHSGYRDTGPAKENGKVVMLAIIGRTGVPDEVRQGERDALAQQTRAALDGAGFEVRINEYGHITVVNR